MNIDPEDFQEDSEFDGLVDGPPNKKKLRAIETMFRSTYRVHVNLSTIADNKANIMISINALMMSIVFSSLITNAQLKSVFWIPIGILLVASLTSIVFAALSAMPRVKTTPLTMEEIMKGEKGILFFGNFTQLSPDQFFEGLNKVMDDRALVYKNMSIDLYVMGLVLRRKYKLLRISYQSFTFGLVGAALIFMVAFISG